jgi:hypothetical protein
MSDSVILGGDISFPTRTATMETLFDHLRRHLPDDPEFQSLVTRERAFEAVEGWFFDTLSPDALTKLKHVLDHLTADPTAASHRCADRRHFFHSNLETFRKNLARRIAQTA